MTDSPSRRAIARATDSVLTIEGKLFGASATADRGDPGCVLAAGERLVVGCGQGTLAVSEVQPAGRMRLPVAEWARGRGIAVGARLT